jgi:Flp pilus assembly protein TadG
VNRRRRPAARWGDDGSATVEAVVLTPLLVLVVLVAVALGRAVDARIQVNDAAHHAARAASLTYTAEEAQDAAEEAAAAALEAAGASCAAHSVSLRHADLVPGSTVTATVSCRARFGDLLGAALPGSITLDATTTSPVDNHRSTP